MERSRPRRVGPVTKEHYLNYLQLPEDMQLRILYRADVAENSCCLANKQLLSSVLRSGGRIYPVSVPYSNSQSTSKTSVTLSLVMPSQSTLTNGTNTASTLEEGTPTPG